MLPDTARRIAEAKASNMSWNGIEESLRNDPVYGEAYRKIESNAVKNYVRAAVLKQELQSETTTVQGRTRSVWVNLDDRRKAAINAEIARWERETRQLDRQVIGTLPTNLKGAALQAALIEQRQNAGPELKGAALQAALIESRPPETAPGAAQQGIVASYEGGQSRMVTDYEAAAYFQTSGGASTPADNRPFASSGPAQTGKAVIKPEYKDYKGGATQYTAYAPQPPKPKTEKVFRAAPASTTKWYDVPAKLRSFALKQEQEASRGTTTGLSSPPVKRFLAAGAGVVSGVTQPFFHPIETVKGTINMVKNPGSFRAGLQESFRTNPYYASGELTGTLILPKVAGKVGGAAKDFYVKAGSTYVPPESVFAKSVLSGIETLPTAKNLPQARQRFLNTKDSKGAIYADTASPAKIAGKTARVGKKASPGLEDPGIYVTPRGEGSPYFLRLKDNVDTQYSLNPFKDLRSRLGVPTVTRFKAPGGLGEYPKQVLLRPGFEAVKTYQESQAGSGKIFITKRSMIGQGALPRQRFVDNTGRLMREAGTSEIEGVVPVGQSFRYTSKSKVGRFKGFDEYTKYEGRAVALREAELLTNKTKASSPAQKIISGKQVAREQSSLSSVAKSYKTPKVSVLSVQSYPSKTAANSYLPGSKAYNNSPTSYNPAASRPSTVSSSRLYTPRSYVSPLKSSSYLSPSSRSSSASALSNSSYTISGSSSRIPGPSYVTTKFLPPNKLKDERKDGLYDFFVRKKGVDVRVSLKPLTRKAASEALASRLENTAGASGFLVERGTGRRVKPLLSGPQWMTSKKDPFRIIQAANYRIGSSGELREITYKGQRSRKQWMRRT